MKNPRSALTIAAFIACSLISCSGSDGGSADPEGNATGSTCNSTSRPSYESFGRAFMTEFCTRCHSSTLTGSARNGAPEDHDFDTLEGILSVREHIDRLAGAGPNATNTIMPPSGKTPSEGQRRLLAEWLACEALEQ